MYIRISELIQSVVAIDMCNIPCVCAVHAMVLCMVTGAAALLGPRELSVVANYRLGSNNNIILRWSPPP